MKKYVKWTIGITAGMLMLITVFMIMLDPLLQYHMPWFGLKPIVSDNEQYTVPGLAKNYEYTNAIIGTSMSENFRPSWFDDIYGGKTAKLTIMGSHPVEYHKVLDLVLDSNSISNVIMNVDCQYLESDPDVGRWKDLPDYLYDINYLNDSSYLLNKEIILKFGRKLIEGNISGKETDFDTLFSWDADAVYNEESVKNLIEADVEVCDEDVIKCYESWSGRNIDSLYTVISDNPSVRFTIFVAPFSIAWWFDEYRAGKLDYWENTYCKMCEKLLDLNNVDIYFFADQKSESIITDLNNYKDKEHYSAEINKYIADCIQSCQNKLTNENYSEILNHFFAFIEGYDYSQLL